MKIYHVPGLMLTTACILLTACGTLQTCPSRQAEPALYVLKNPGEVCRCKEGDIPDHVQFNITETEDALKYLRARTPSGAPRPLILYVHGRAGGAEGEPCKSLREVVPCLEQEYGADVLMFFWPGAGDGGLLGYPKGKARDAAWQLAKVLEVFSRVRTQQATNQPDQKMVLLTHSLGSFTVEKLLRSHVSGSLPSNLFDTVVLSSPASKAADHASWLGRCDFSRHRYVSVNANDTVLRFSVLRQIEAALGRKLTSGILFKEEVPLAAQVTYVSLSRADIHKHRYFISSGQEKSVGVQDYYQDVLRGVAHDFSHSNQIARTEERDGSTIYYIKTSEGQLISKGKVED